MIIANNGVNTNLETIQSILFLFPAGFSCSSSQSNIRKEKGREGRDKKGRERKEGGKRES